jgi:ribosomal protein S18 acetylase RimI-like enzyme
MIRIIRLFKLRSPFSREWHQGISMLEINIVTNEEQARKVGEFLIGPNSFDHTWIPNEKEFVKKAPLETLTDKNHRYFYVEDAGKIIAAIGIRENKYGNGGYEMDEDYFAVHKKYRNQGIASQLLLAVENYVRQNHGRYVHVLSCDAEMYLPARKFYEKNGYRKVAEIPDYYVPGEGRIDYFKKME